MKTAWAVLIISALTDFLITVGTALQASMYQTDAVTGTITVVMPSNVAIIATLLGAALIGARTIQQKLATTLSNLAELKGAPPPEMVKEDGQMVTKITTPLEPAKEDQKVNLDQVREVIAAAKEISDRFEKLQRVEPTEVKKPTPT